MTDNNKNLTENYMNTYNMLLGYDIKEGVKSKFISEATILKTNEAEDIDMPPSDDTFESPDVEQIQKQEAINLAPVDDMTRVKEIQDLQTDKIRELDEYAKQLEQEVLSLKYQMIDIDAIKTNLNIVNQKVDDVTPLSGEDQLANMANVGGGLTISQYWANYLEKKKPYDIVTPTNIVDKPMGSPVDINANSQNGNDNAEDINISTEQDNDGDTIYVIKTTDIKNYDTEAIKKSIVGDGTNGQFRNSIY